MATISFRADEQTERELRRLAQGRDRSTVLGEIIHEAYVERRYAQAEEDVERLRHDETDRAELARIAEEMGDGDAW